MFQGFISKFTKNNLVKTAAAACIAASVAFGQAQIGSSNTYWQVTGTSNNRTLTISGTGAMPTNFTSSGGNNPWYAQRASITSVVIGDGVTTIGASAFSGCTGLTSVTIPNSVTYIGGWAFSSCMGLKSVTIPNSVTSIGSSAFAYCMGLKSVTIGNSVTSIGDGAFESCAGLTSVTIPASVTSIGEEAFHGCTGLTAINVDASNASYSSVEGVLFNKAKTTLIKYPAAKTGAYTIPASVTSIRDFAFSGCTGLTSVTIPNSVTSIGDGAFWNCTGLTSVTIPNSVTFIESYAFGGCTKLTAINVDASNANYASDNGVLFNKAKTTLITYPAAKAGAYTIPNSVTTIGDWAFSGCTGLTSVTIPASVTFIGSYAFGDCTGLKQIISRKETPLTINANVFDNVTAAKLFVPARAVSAYKDATGWSNFSAKTAAIPFTVRAEIGVGENLATFDAGYAGEKVITWVSGNAAVVIENGKITAGAGNTARITATLDGDYFSDVFEVAVIKGNPAYTAPTGLTAKVGQTLADVSPALPAGWSWMNPATVIAAPLSDQMHKAKFTPTDVANYNVLENIDVKVTVSAAAANPIRDIQKSDGRTGIRLSKNVVSDKAEFEVILPSDKVLEVRAVIYDNTGNAVFEKTQNSAKFVWNLTNAAGRNVANGTYLIIVEAKGINGTYAYSAKVGVKK